MAWRVAFFLLFLAWCGLPLSCEVDSSEYEPMAWDGIDFVPDAIVGGTETNYESWTAAVGLWYDQGGGYGNICTATLIDPEVLITAGHCVYLKTQGIDAVKYPSRLDVLGGAEIIGLGRISYSKAAKIVVHPEWTGDLLWGSVDLAMIKLTTPITSLEPYGLRNKSDTVKVGEAGKIVGYGLTSSSEMSTAGFHRVGDTTVLTAVENHLLELGNPAGTCMGDSGGPFFTKRAGKWLLTGVTSFGTSAECRSDRDSWDANVLGHWDWIDSTLQDLVGRALQEEEAGEGEGWDGEGEGEEEEEEEEPINHPFGVSSENPVDCQCNAVGRPVSMSFLLFLLSAW